jgi:hypothetical protein
VNWSAYQTRVNEEEFAEGCLTNGAFQAPRVLSVIGMFLQSTSIAYRDFADTNLTELIDLAISSTCCLFRLVKVQLTSVPFNRVHTKS